MTLAMCKYEEERTFIMNISPVGYKSNPYSAQKTSNKTNSAPSFKAGWLSSSRSAEEFWVKADAILGIITKHKPSGGIGAGASSGPKFSLVLSSGSEIDCPQGMSFKQIKTKIEEALNVAEKETIEI